MAHENFCFIPIPDKTNDLITVLGPFLTIFAQWRFSQKNPALSHTSIYEPLTPCKVSEKTNEPILRKLMDRMDGQKDRLYFIGPFWLRPEV